MTEEKREKRRPASHAVEEKKALGLLLAKARTRAGFTMDAAAKAIGLSDKRAVDNFEKGRNVPDALRLKQLAKLYTESSDTLVGLTSNPPWPFSLELRQEVDRMGREDLQLMEVAIWGYLRKPVPELHYVADDERQPKEVPTPTTLLFSGISPRSDAGDFRKKK